MTVKKPSQFLFISGGTLTILGAVAQLFNIVQAPYIFAFGAGLMIYFQLLLSFHVHRDDVDKRTQRLARIGLFSSLLLALATYFMFKGSNSWVVALLIYALSSFSLSFRGNSESEK
ncbi:MAG: hypothetical protein WCG93_11230 [Paludibacter sp.]